MSFIVHDRTIHQLRIEKREGGQGTRLWVDDLEGYLGLVHIGAVELHPWNAILRDKPNANAGGASKPGGALSDSSEPDG
jgi:DNA primase